MNLYQAATTPNAYKMELAKIKKEGDYLEVVTELQFSGYILHKRGLHKGYVNFGYFVTVPYAGKYGVGVAIFRHCVTSNNYYNVEYWIL